MFDPSATLGERITQAARLAVQMHLLETVSEFQVPRQQVTIGGTGQDSLKDEMLLTSSFMVDIAEGGAE